MNVNNLPKDISVFPLSDVVFFPKTVFFTIRTLWPACPGFSNEFFCIARIYFFYQGLFQPSIRASVCGKRTSMYRRLCHSRTWSGCVDDHKGQISMAEHVPLHSGCVVMLYWGPPWVLGRLYFWVNIPHNTKLHKSSNNIFLINACLWLIVEKWLASRGS